jgi:hypothetical protein
MNWFKKAQKVPLWQLSPDGREYAEKSDEELCYETFGFSPYKIKQMHPNSLSIKWKDDLKNVIEEQKNSGLSPQDWARQIDLSEPIDVIYEDGVFKIDDGHHRYYAAKILNKMLNVSIEIKDNPHRTSVYNAYNKGFDIPKEVLKYYPELTKTSELIRGKIKTSTAKTLYHGTSIDNYTSIKNIGLIPDVGDFVRWGYESEYENAGIDFDPIPLIYATDKEDLRKAVNAMEQSVKRLLGKENISLNELKNYGMLVVIKEGADYFQQRPWEESGPLGDWHGETDNQYLAVEPGDYFSEEGQDGYILTGNKMMLFLKRNEAWPGYGDEDREQQRNDLLTMVIRYHVKEYPQEDKNNIIETIKNKIKNMTDEEVVRQYRLYSERINELV